MSANDNLKASAEHEKSFRANFRLRDDLADDPEAQMAFEYAATHKLNPREMAYIGAATVRIEALRAEVATEPPRGKGAYRFIDPKFLQQIREHTPSLSSDEAVISFLKTSGQHEMAEHIRKRLAAAPGGEGKEGQS